MNPQHYTDLKDIMAKDAQQGPPVGIVLELTSDEPMGGCGHMDEKDDDTDEQPGPVPAEVADALEESAAHLRNLSLALKSMGK
tara:strand:- start:4881 stop:5129 length:249 start_codon:yes stop_codon:yes gene_type:complete